MRDQRGDGYFYPDHSIGISEIASKEYELAASIVRANSLTLGALTALYALASSAAGLFGLINPANLVSILGQLSESDWYVRPSLLTVLIATCYAVTASLANAREEYVISARKIIIIRKLANVQFGLRNLILPSWRFEAARHPYAIRKFEGWKLHRLFPLLFSLSALSWAIVLVLSTFNLSMTACVSFGIFNLLGFIAYYRSRLFEDCENWLLLLTYAVADLIECKLDERRAYVLYHARLGVLEADRLGVKFDNLKSMIVFREDRSFWKNNGISVRGTARAIYQTLFKSNRQGGSTITQQLFRTLYVREYDKSFRRKILESLGALWLKSSLENEEILDLYICSVRYGPNSYGLLAARKTLQLHSNPISKADAFILAERVSNIGKNVRWGGINNSLETAVKSNLLTPLEQSTVLQRYDNLIRNGILNGPQQ